MKAVMYHYVRPGQADLPHFRYLHVDDFRRQLDAFTADEGIVPRADFEAALASGRPPERGYVLTFDDGFADHYRYVLPELRARGLWGVFYLPTGPYASGRVLDVHRIHYLLGLASGIDLLRSLEELVEPCMLRQEYVDAFGATTYLLQDNDAATQEVKRVLNYYIDYAFRETVIDALERRHAPAGMISVDRIYLAPGQIREMQDVGMIVGSHTVTHRLLSKLSVAEQAEEIAASFDYLEQATGGLALRTFCYPYGGFQSFTPDTERLLSETGCLFAFNVEERDVAESDLRDRPQALPRYDCNLFPHGQARLGLTPPEVKAAVFEATALS